MHKNVLEHEPENALYVTDDEPLIFYERIIEIARNQLKSKGEIYFEINEYFSREVIRLLETNNFTNVLLRRDINDKPRMIKATKP